ncbi:MAG: tRNA (adenosine(37)-N6)-dimethylallyltransferase MiaA [Nitrospiraceae bacterium]|nr:tRNA (adenosine(37)-N6)-dimethylallyltransferase MiaA [Nitrospiraceae bacterium]
MVPCSDSLLSMRPLIVVVGPTAVGKSEIALSLAAALDTEILTADSRQVYRGMDIATDKPPLALRRGIAHRLIDLVEPDEPFNAGDYRAQAQQEIVRLYAAGRVPLVVGGTGLYVRTLVRGLCDAPRANPAYRDELVRAAREADKGFLHRRLSQIDPESAARLHPNDEVKIIRALEVHHVAGRRLSDLHREHAFADHSFSVLMLGLMRDREELYRRIDERVDGMFARGLIAETESLLAKGYGRALGSMKGLGYRQVCGYLAGEYDRAEALRLLKRDTRHFAKRQLTWFRSEPALRWYQIGDHEDPETVAARVLRDIRAFLAGLESQSEAARPGASAQEGVKDGA